MSSHEPILDLSKQRYTYFPIEYNNLHKLYVKQIDCFWRVEEIDLSQDSHAFDKLTSDEKFFIAHVLAFFAMSDSLIMDNIMENFLNEVIVPEAKSFYSFQSAMESIHSFTYSLLIDSIIKDNPAKEKLFNAINEFPAIEYKNMWIKKWFNKKRTFASRLVAFACVEGIFFSGSFCSIFWLKKRGISMKGLIFSNELISRDEALHTEFAIELFNTLVNKPSTYKIKEIIKEAVLIEQDFIIESLPCRLVGMNSDLMKKYIEFVGDRLAVQLCGEKIYNTENPFVWMEMISLEGKTNFFENKVSDYALASTDKTEEDFKLDSDCF